MFIPQLEIIKNEPIPKDLEYMGLKVVHFQNDNLAQSNFIANKYQFQHEDSQYNSILGTLCRK